MDTPSSPPMIGDKLLGQGQSAPTRWFRGFGNDASNCQTIKPARDIIQGHQDFTNRFRQRSEISRPSFEIVATKATLEQQVARYGGAKSAGHDLELQASEAIGEATKVVGLYEERRLVGGGRIGRKTQNFIKSFADFLAVYSGLVEQLAGAGSIYGGVAYETLSIFFVVVVNKASNDTKMANLLSDLSRSFPRLEEWVNMYPSPSLEHAVAEVYKEVITFSRKATEYFSRLSTRLLMAIGKPPSMGIDLTAETIQAKLANVTTECRFQLHSRTKQINTIVEDSNARIKYLQRENAVLLGSLERLDADHRRFVQEVEVRNRQDDSQRLEAFKLALKISHPRPETDVDACKHTQSQAFTGLELSYTQMSVDMLDTSHAFRKWKEYPGASVLYLSGLTQTAGRNSLGYTHSWLSPATTHVVSMMRNQGCKVAYYCFHPGVRADPHDARLGTDLIASVIYQVLEWKPNIVRNKHESLRAMIDSDSWQKPEDDDAAIEFAFRVLREVLNGTMDLGTVFMILDRVDLCSWRFPLLVRQLTQLVKDSESTLKVMCTSSSSLVSHWDPDDTARNAEKGIFAHSNWDQRQLSSLEKQVLERRRLERVSLTAKSR